MQRSKVSIIAQLSKAQLEGDPGLDVTTRFCSSFAAQGHTFDLFLGLFSIFCQAGCHTSTGGFGGINPPCLVSSVLSIISDIPLWSNK